ncbi:hypothetical protein [Subtercola sp. Z020]|uniref:hypothetical protein n=1 Tax=Subtercola sp. Z020 TaxID=2080582 RepID=UPI0011B05297|nr:hypothetical protein [Subtercola sp. Z020]
MRPRLAAVTVLAVAGGASLLVEQQRRRRDPQQSGEGEPASRWRSVTVILPLDEVAPGGSLPGSLTTWGPDVETRVRRAPGDKGTEISARFRRSASADRSKRAEGDRARRLRRSLREAKQLIEVGEILRVDPTPHGRRKATPMGAVVEFATDRGAEEGLL